MKLLSPLQDFGDCVKIMRQDEKSGWIQCSIPCNLCGATEARILANRSRSGNPLRTVICPQCGLAWTDPLPHNPRDFYQDDYRISYKGTYTPKPKHILRAGKVALHRHGKIARLLEKKMAILDIGSGGGEFAYLLKTLGHDVQGIEPNKGYADYSIRQYGLDVQVGFVQDARFQGKTFELITIWHVLEHTENPFGVLLKLHDLLQPEGMLVIEVPNMEATCQSPKSTFHEAHIFNFNPATLQKLAAKAGFTFVEHSMSDDGGNITIIVQKKSAGNPGKLELNIQGNAEKIIGIVRNHTPIKHYLTLRPYARLLRRVRQSLAEKRKAGSAKEGKVLLDALYATLARDHRANGSGAAA